MHGSPERVKQFHADVYNNIADAIVTSSISMTMDLSTGIA
jgi:hypothetical protein